VQKPTLIPTRGRDGQRTDAKQQGKKEPKAAHNMKRKGAHAATVSGFAGMQAKLSENQFGKKK
jgi:hypothetical protein